jgi:hypothetical protein
MQLDIEGAELAPGVPVVVDLQQMLGRIVLLDLDAIVPAQVPPRQLVIAEPAMNVDRPARHARIISIKPRARARSWSP